MSERTPDPGSELEEEGVPDHEGPLPEKVATGDPQEGYPPPAERPTHPNDSSATPDDQGRVATINTRLQEEQPEREPTFDPEQTTDDPYPTGVEDDPGESTRVVESDEGAVSGTEQDTIGQSAGTDTGDLSDEERAMHIAPEGEPGGENGQELDRNAEAGPIDPEREV